MRPFSRIVCFKLPGKLIQVLGAQCCLSGYWSHKAGDGCVRFADVVKHQPHEVHRIVQCFADASCLKKKFMLLKKVLEIYAKLFSTKYNHRYYPVFKELPNNNETRDKMQTWQNQNSG